MILQSISLIKHKKIANFQESNVTSSVGDLLIFNNSLFKTHKAKTLFSDSLISHTVVSFLVSLVGMLIQMHRFDWPSSITWDDFMQLVCFLVANPVPVKIEMLYQNVMIFISLSVIGPGTDREDGEGWQVNKENAFWSNLLTRWMASSQFAWSYWTSLNCMFCPANR